MANVSLSRGVKTRGGCGGTIGGDGFTPGEILDGTGGTDWTVDSTGAIVPAGSYATKPYVAFTKAAGQTYSLTGHTSGRTVDILMVAAQADISWLTGDTQGANQFKTLFELAYNANGALKTTDTIMMRDGMVYNPTGAISDSPKSPVPPTNGWAGCGTIVGGSGYTGTTFPNTPLAGGSGTGATANILVSGNAVVQVHIQQPGSGYQAGDVLTAPSLGGTGFTFTVIDLAATVTVRSETIENGFDPLHPTERLYGGGAKIAGLRIDDTALNIPFTFKYIWFYYNINNPYTAVATFTVTTTGTFTVGETVTFSNGATATVTSWTVGASKTLGVNNIAGSPVLAATTITGAGAVGTIVSVSLTSNPFMLGYRNTTGWGISTYWCRFENGPLVPGGLDGTTLRTQTGMVVRQASCTYCSFKSLRRGITGTGESTFTPTRVTEFGHNIFRGTEGGDASGGLQGANWWIHDNFYSGFLFRSSGAHDDTLQYNTQVDGVAHPNIGIIEKNVSIRGPAGSSSSGHSDSQGWFIKGTTSGGRFDMSAVSGTFVSGHIVTFNNGTTATVQAGTTGSVLIVGKLSSFNVALATTATDSNGATATLSNWTPTTYAGLTIRNNITLLTDPNQIYFTQVTGPDVQWNTSPAFFNATDYTYTLNNNIQSNGIASAGGTVARNIANGNDFSESSPAPTQPDNLYLTLKTLAEYDAVWPTYSAVSNTVDTYEDVIAMFTPSLNGSAKVTSGPGIGTYAGALFPDGSWNNGTVYNATPATVISSSILLSSIQVGASTTVTYQLDAAAITPVIITPTKSGTGTGTFSAATVTIGTGEVSGTVDITATGVGTLNIGCTNNAGLTNPATLPLTITAAPVAPTTFTQSASPTTTNPGGLLTLTYVLNAPATAATTITAACTLSGSFVQGTTVAIPFGETTGTLTFIPSLIGTATFSATNDKSLTNPANIAVTVSACSVGQLKRLHLA